MIVTLSIVDGGHINPTPGAARIGKALCLYL
jgi:hypothetical protein